MLNDETRRKLRLMNIGEFVEELEIQQQDLFFATPFWRKLQKVFGECCIAILAKVATTIPVSNQDRR